MITESRRTFSHPALVSFWVLAGFGIILAISRVPIQWLMVPLGIAGYCCGYWNKHMLVLEEIEEVSKDKPE
jgi:uncharacterized membrane protein AbrB (regulator of aidB expression)